MHIALDLVDEVGTRVYGATRNLGLGGLRVYVPANLLYPNAQVSVHFPEIPRRRFPGTVIWTSGNSAGLMFDDFDVGGLRAIWNILSQQRLKKKYRLFRKSSR